MGYFDASDLTDVVDELEELLDEYKDYDSVELVENADNFQTKFEELLKKVRNASSDFVYEYENLEDKKEEAEGEISSLTEDVRDLMNSSVSNLYDLQKKRVCLDLFKNLSLDELENLENKIKTERVNYTTSTLSDVETN